MSQLLVGGSIRRDCIADAVHVLYGDRARRTGKGRYKRVPDADTAYVVRAYIANLDVPSPAQITLYSQIPLLRVRRVSIKRHTRKRRQPDRAVRSRATII